MTPNQLIEATKQLVAIPSTSDNPEALHQALDFIAAMTGKARPEITVERFESNGKPSLLAYREKQRPAKFDVILNGHLDVVPGKPEQFKAVINDDKLYGRGVYDMKAACVILTAAFCEYVLTVPYNLGLQIVTDEESAGQDGTLHQIEQGVRADFVISGESGRAAGTYEIANEAKGVVIADIGFRGTAAHSAYPWKGDNAVLKATRFVKALHERYPVPTEPDSSTLISVTAISADSGAHSTLPDYAVVKLAARYVAGDPIFKDEDSFASLIKEIDSEAEVVDLHDFTSPIYTRPDNPLLVALKASAEKVEGATFSFVRRHGTGDGRFYGDVGNEACEFGIAGGDAHGDNEYISLQAFRDYHATMRDFLASSHLQSTPAKVPTPRHHPTLGGPLHETLLRKLISFQTLSDDIGVNRQALDFVGRFLAARGMHCTRSTFDDRAVLLASSRPDNAMRPSVLLAAHMDVARAQESQFNMLLKDGKIYGRGVYDMKGAIAAYMALVDELQDHLADYDFSILITTDEEYGGQNGINGTARMMELGLAPGVCVLPDSAAPGWNLEGQVKGPWRFELIASGQAAHGSRPWEGDSATSKLIKALHELEAKFADQHHMTDSINIGAIHGGTEFNEVAINASANVEIRLLNQASIAKNRTIIDALCEKYGIQYVQKTFIEPQTHNLSHPLVQSFMQSITAITGHVPESVISLGASDAKYFSRQNIPCVLSCPDGGGHHGDNEWVDRKQFAQMVPILKHYLSQEAYEPPKTPKTTSGTPSSL